MRKPIRIWKSLWILLPVLALSGAASTLPACPSPHPNENRIYKASVKTALLHKEGFEMSAPVINLNSGEQLKLSFDELGSDLEQYRFTIVHCESDWTLSSDLMTSEYIDGFTDDLIRDYAYSFNTTVQYIHYWLTFPTANLKPKLSGNYLILVYLDDTSNLILTRRFMVVENTPLTVSGSAHQSNSVTDRFTGQQVDFTLEYNGMVVNDPVHEIKPVVAQNDRLDNEVRDLKPRFVRGNSLDYTDEPRLLFNGGNEYRSFDIKSLLYQSERIRKIDYDRDGYQVYLLDDQRRTKNYVTDREINGRKLIKNEEHARNSEVEADYARVHFFLPFETPVINGQIFLLGSLTDWLLNDDSRMEYDASQKGYVKSLFVKQGYYNYLYVFRDFRSGKTDESLIEGNHWETENEYTVRVYYRPSGSQYDRLIAVRDFNTVH